MKKSKYPILTLLVLLSTTVGFAQNLYLSAKTENIEVKSDSSFVREITIAFKKSPELRAYPILFDTELEKVSNIKIFRKRKTRLKELDLGRVVEEDVDLEYIASKRIKVVKIPKDEEIHLKYSVSCHELMYLSSLSFFSYNNIDTLRYKIKVPKEFDLSYKLIYKDSLQYFSLDSVKTDAISTWNIKTVPQKVTHNPLQFFGIYKNLKVPMMKALVAPVEYKDRSLAYMNNWYYKNLGSKRGLNYASKLKIDELTAGITDQNKILDVLYNYVKSNFKYVAIEIGMGAFIPSHANEVFSSKQGDCKDLSNFLSEALNYKGIKSDVALAATFDHTSDCDFPSLSSANHVICIAYIGNKEILLDPTDPIHTQETPVQSLQTRTILVVNAEGGKFLEVKPFSPQQNKISCQMSLKLDSSTMLITGSFDINYAGISDNYLQRAYTYQSGKKFDTYIKSYFEEIFRNQPITNLVTTNTNRKLSFKGDITISGKTFNDGASKYLFPDFLPKLIETESRESLLDGTYIKYPFQKEVKVSIQLDEAIEKFETKKYKYGGEGASLIVKIGFVSDQEVQLTYDFIFDHIFINRNNIDITNDILKSFKKVINEPIIFKKKKV